MNLPTSAVSGPYTDEELLASFKALPTEDDLPCDDGEPMETPRHQEQMHMLIDSLKMAWSARRDYYVGGNMFLYYDPDDKRRSRGPDFFLVLDVPDAERERKSWVPWQEGMRFPDVIIELLSDTTRHIDKGVKKTLYAGLFRTAEYYLYDPFSQEFIGYRLQGRDYDEIAPDDEGKIYSTLTGLYLGVRGEQLRWITPEGEVLATPMERAEQEHQRAEQEHQRAEQEHQRAEQERLRAEEAEKLIAEYRRRFGNLE